MSQPYFRVENLPSQRLLEQGLRSQERQLHSRSGSWARVGVFPELFRPGASDSRSWLSLSRDPWDTIRLNCVLVAPKQEVKSNLARIAQLLLILESQFNNCGEKSMIFTRKPPKMASASRLKARSFAERPVAVIRCKVPVSPGTSPNTLA